MTTARVSDRVGGLKVHSRPGILVLVEPKELWPGYHVELIGKEYQGRQKLWAEVRYLYDSQMRTGWVIKEALDVIEPPKPPPVHAPPVYNGKFRNGYEATWMLLLMAAVFVIVGLIAYGLASPWLH